MRKGILSGLIYVLPVVMGMGSFSAAAWAQQDATNSAPQDIRTPSPEGAHVYIISPADGAVVSSPVVVRFGLAGMGVAPAGVDKEKTGHHHLVIDQDLPPLDRTLPATSETFQHFGGGQTQVVLDLAPGEHTLQLIFGDKAHLPHNPPLVSDKITITVE